jgi:hypothetical protein
MKKTVSKIKTEYPNPFYDPFHQQFILIQKRKNELFKRDPIFTLKRENTPPDEYERISKTDLPKKWNTTLWRNEGSPNLSIGRIRKVLVGECVRSGGKKIVTGKNISGEVDTYYERRIREGNIFIIINPSLLTLNDEKKVKTHVWNMVKREILNIKEKEGIKNGWDPLAPPGEHKEIAFIYRIGEETFRKYLKWYDWHLQHKIGFRLIAFTENQSAGDIDKANSLIEKIIKKPKKPKVGNYNPSKNIVAVSGEDKIEKAVKLIYKAIHRKPYSKTKIVPLLYLDNRNCPEHGNIANCPFKCQYLQDWYNTANRILPPKN